MKLLKLHDMYTGDLQLINADEIVAVLTRKETVSKICFKNGEHTYVKESVEEILNQLKELE